MDATRAKTLDRIRKLLRRAARPTSTIDHEARRAQERADALIRYHQVTEAELAEREEAPRRPGPRPAGPIGDRDRWRETLAMAVAHRHGCRPLRARGMVHFDGPDADRAAGEYVRAAAEIERACNACWRAYDYQYRRSMASAYHYTFPLATAEEIGRVWRGDPLNDLSGDWGGEARREGRRIARLLEVEARAGGASHRFVLRARIVGGGGLVEIHANLPGNYATVFLRSEKLRPRGDLHHHDDALWSYLWAFEYDLRPAAGDLLVFATADREVAGRVAGRGVQMLATPSVRVVRDGRGEPVEVVTSSGDARALRTDMVTPGPRQQDIEATKPAVVCKRAKMLGHD